MASNNSRRRRKKKKKAAQKRHEQVFFGNQSETLPPQPAETADITFSAAAAGSDQSAAAADGALAPNETTAEKAVETTVESRGETRGENAPMAALSSSDVDGDAVPRKFPLPVPPAPDIDAAEIGASQAADEAILPSAPPAPHLMDAAVQPEPEIEPEIEPEKEPKKEPKKETAQPEPQPAAHPSFFARLQLKLRVRQMMRLCMQIVILLLIAGSITGLSFVRHEAATSALQSQLLADLNVKLRSPLGKGDSEIIRFPQSGPYDVRLGYTQLPDFIRRLKRRGFAVTQQARISALHAKLIDNGIFPIYKPKSQAGIELYDRNGVPLYANKYPEAVYKEFESIPSVIVDTLLYIEDRNVLNRSQPFRNPAVDWRRFSKAILDMVRNKVDPEHDVHGGSTLATQIEKFRHSPLGITVSPWQKLQQMASASIRGYIDGAQNLQTRRRIVRDYVNNVPLAALPGYGEVTGLADGMWAYFGADIKRVNELLTADDEAIDEAALREKALAFRQVLSLFLAHRRPSEYLRTATTALSDQVDRYLPLLYSESIISKKLFEAAREQNVEIQRILPVTRSSSFLQRKGANALRTHLMQELGVQRLYDLDRMDITAHATLDKKLQDAVSQTLLKLHDDEYIRKVGLDGFRLLTGSGSLDDVIYSVTIYETDGKKNRLVIQTDNYNQPFDINDGVKLDLGSTAKLRTLITYLEVIEEVYRRETSPASSAPAESEKSDAAGKEAAPEFTDRLTTWVKGYMKQNKDATLEQILLAAMERTYSANPGERFFTAGGLHTFENFDKNDNGRVVTVRTALQKSINLPFIRIMRDIVEYFSLHTSGSTARTLRHMDGLTRKEYLTRFADKEGKIFLRRYFRQYAGHASSAVVEQFWDNVQRKPYRFASLFWVFEKENTLESFTAFMRKNCSDIELSDAEIERIYRQYSSRAHTLADKGYMASVHPLELWVVAYLLNNPKASLEKAIEDGAQARQDVYEWLFKTSRRGAQDSRIRIMLEAEAFIEIHRRWKRLGYPLGSLVPSLATALGTSADRPSALAKLMGIVLNDGKRLPLVKIEKISFAEQTPYETHMVNSKKKAKQLLSPELAKIVREALTQVVEQGTAIRLKNSFDTPETKVALGGKTGTGDHRFQVFGPGGRLKESRVMNRTATFVFFIGEHHFGTITAFVHGKEAAKFRFTSALPVQLLKILQPALAPLIHDSQS